MTICKYSDVDFKKIQYNKPDKQGSFYYSSIDYDKKPFHIQSPKMKCNVSGPEMIQKSPITLDCEPLNKDFSFYDFFLNIEDRNIKETFKKNKEWFDKEIPLDIIDDMYKRTIKAVKKDCIPKFSFKLPTVKGKIQCQIFDQHKICQDIQKVAKDCEIIFVLHIRGLKFLKQHYYCDCYISQIKIFISKDEQYNLFKTCVIEDDEIKEDDIDIVDEEVLFNIAKEKEELKKKEEKRKLIESQMEDLKKQLDNL